MKIVRMQHGKEIDLWRFVSNNLPESLQAIKRDDGYGHVFGIHIKEYGLLKRINPFSEKIASVRCDEIELFHPQYYSDIELIISKYEQQTGKEVKFKYWED